MSLGSLFWVLYLLWIFVGGYAYYDTAAGLRWRPFGGHLLLGLLLFILAWGEFGFIVNGAAHR